MFTARDVDDKPSGFDVPAVLLLEPPTYPYVVNRRDRSVYHYTDSQYVIKDGDKVEVQVSGFTTDDHVYRRALPFAIIYPPQQPEYEAGSIWGRMFHVTPHPTTGWNSEVRSNTWPPGSPDAYPGMGGDQATILNLPTDWGVAGKAWIFEFSNTGYSTYTLGVSLKISEVGNLGNNATSDISKLHTEGTTFTLCVGNSEGIFWTDDPYIQSVRNGVQIDSVTFTVA